MSEITTIRLEKSTRDFLKRFGVKGETYDQIIRRLTKGQEPQKAPSPTASDAPPRDQREARP